MLFKIDCKKYIFFTMLIFSSFNVQAQPNIQEDWSIHTQVTIINQYDLPFRKNPYENLNEPPHASESLGGHGEDRETISNTWFLGRRLPWRGGEFYWDPEFTQGVGLSHGFGAADFPNGEALKGGLMETSFHSHAFLWNNTARVFYRQTFNLSNDYVDVPSDQNQLAQRRATTYLQFDVGKMASNDYFDTNLYANNARTQFMNWAFLTNLAWDFPGNSKSYTEGLTMQYVTPHYTLRYGIWEPPRSAGSYSLGNIAKYQAQALEIEKPYTLMSHSGKVRIGVNLEHANMGNWQEAVANRSFDITTVRKRRYKGGATFNLEQELTKHIGFFSRIGWNDDRQEELSNTESGSAWSGGLNFNGAAWHRNDDQASIAYDYSAISKFHKRYLAGGGQAFILGDGALRYCAEQALETYYLLHVLKNTDLTLDYQLIENPGYNRDRGPANIFSLRLHYQF